MLSLGFTEGGSGGKKAKHRRLSPKALFRARCFDSATTLQIAREAGLTEPAIYYHFPLYFELVDQRPHEIGLIVSTCPARLKDPGHICTRNIRRARKRVLEYVEKSLEAGIRAGEFFPVPVAETAGLLMAMISGLVRQRSPIPEAFNDLKDATVAFCKRSLVNSDFR